MTIPQVASRDDVQVAARLFRGLAEPTRLALLTALRDGERTVSELMSAVGASQSGVSGHLACLRDCGLVTSRPGPGRSVWYRLASPRLQALLRAAEELLADGGHPVTLCAEQGRRPR
ncbi:metalloregulator ArsR/SmtB family transcription factor [Micromonospora aurantiaca]|uniref:ArsR family transcriptional regulator n=1 Tax=Micromonospora aurantiaca (nom. illeg.) TaxID=47850 RepID=A0A3M9JZC9_9ACTN|nr:MULTISPECIES: metalloregulator ArsR/SmtB family transcription factor [Micromonospora]ADU09705.1 regulatory protein ArsR [Micromonospora sp. L5]AXH93670.1 ArsR family transcriptional regulator [Micromonospora aurantiaca]KAB1108436.1 winged helix-turn-helix transcriptional regulator [Micromonospora aurantiaca]MBC9004366.1 winged helix-turn-helix transcriptional regulator [Micromonospora aurantiaca]MDG4752848.1 metalloregulator ArsR/SmtB family transcription factor [Micromonospora sp. WMMD718]